MPVLPRGRLDQRVARLDPAALLGVEQHRTPMRSLTEPPGFMNSHLPSSSHGRSRPMRDSRTIGVCAGGVEDRVEDRSGRTNVHGGAAYLIWFPGSRPCTLDTPSLATRASRESTTALVVVITADVFRRRPVGSAGSPHRRARRSDGHDGPGARARARGRSGAASGSRDHPTSLKGCNDLLVAHQARRDRGHPPASSCAPAPTSSRPTRSPPRRSRSPTTG